MANSLMAAAKGGQSTASNAVISMLDKQAPAIAAALPSFMDVAHFKRVVTTEIRNNPRLAQCEPITVISAVMLAAQIGLEPGQLGQCYLIPYSNYKTKRLECQFQMGYMGVLELCHRSGAIADVTAESVHENDEWHMQLGDDPKIHHRPASWPGVRGKAIGYYCVIRTHNGGVYRKAMSRQEIEDHAAEFSKSYKDKKGPWVSNFDAMARKTVLLQCLKLAPKSIEMKRGIQQDGVVRHDIAGDMAGAHDVDATIVDDDEPDRERLGVLIKAARDTWPTQADQDKHIAPLCKELGIASLTADTVPDELVNLAIDALETRLAEV